MAVQPYSATAPIKALSGSQTSPRITFTGGDTDTGIYSPGANQVGITTGGTSKLIIDENGSLQVVRGTKDLPAIYFDSGTGIYSPGADQVAISTNGAGRLFIDASGNVGFNKSNPLDPIDVAGGIRTTGATSNANVTGGLIDWNNGTRIFAYATGGAPIQFYTNASGGNVSERLRITSDGKLGLGTSSPDELLHIQGDTAEFKGTNTNQIETTTGTEQVFKFSIEGQKNNVYGPAGSIIFRQDGLPWSATSANYKPTRLEFCTQTGNDSDASETPRLVIDRNGKVGIGTTSPSTSLHVAGSASVNSSAVGAASLTVGPDSGASGTPVLAFSSANTSSQRIDFGDPESSSIGRITYSHSNNSLTFRTNASDAATIDSSGRLLVGTSTALAVGGAQHIIQTESTATTTVHGASFIRHGGTLDIAGSAISLARTRGTSPGAVTAVANGDTLGYIIFNGANGTDISNNAAWIRCDVDGEPFTSGDTTDLPGRLVFSVTADGSAAPTEALRITNDRYVRLASGSGGIQFNGDTAAANALDDYEEGTWTVSVYDAASGGNVSATTTTGYYTKIGRCVSCLFTGITNIDTTGMTAGNLVYVSLPFVSNLSTSALPGGTLFIEGLTLPASNTYVTPFLSYGNARFIIYTGGASGGPRTALTVGGLTSGTTDFRYFQMTYFV